MPAVQLFYTCLVNDFAPEVGFAVARVLERLGYDVHVPDGLTCCGQPAFNAGFHDAARAAARQTLNALDATEGPIVIPSGSCGDMLIHQYDALFADDRDDWPWRESARRVAARCREFSAFVAGHDVAALRLACATPTRVLYHPSCHLLRGLGVSDEPRAIIQAVQGATLVDAALDECCGFGGLFSVKHGDISTRMLERKLQDFASSGADRLVSCDLGCLLHLGGGLHRRRSGLKVQHLSELLDEALP